MHWIVQKTKANTSPIIAAMALALLIIYIVIAMEASSSIEFTLEDEIKGVGFGVSSIVLFLVAFILEFREKSIITSGMLISGGVTMGSLSLARVELIEAGIANITISFANAASVGYIIMGLGILHFMKTRESRD